MASTNKTTHFILSQFVGTDKASWLADYNNDMIKIDLALKTIQDLTVSADGKSTSAVSGLNALDLIVDGVLTDIGLLNPYKAKVDALEIEIDTKANLDSPVLIGNPTTPTQTVGNNSTNIASTEFVINQVNAMAIRKDNTGSPIVVNGQWVGTQGQYDAIGSKNPNVLYFVI